MIARFLPTFNQCVNSKFALVWHNGLWTEKALPVKFSSKVVRNKEMGFRDLDLKGKYKSYDDDLANDFLAPVLSQASSYDRMVGYFSSATLEFLRDSLELFVERGGTIRLIIGEPLAEAEYEAVVSGATELLANKVAERVSSELDSEMLLPPGLTALRLLSWLVANKRLEIKFAAVSHSKAANAMMHDKTGIVRDSQGDILVFQGTANETVFGLMPGYNYEKISVYMSWIDNESFVNYALDEIDDFELTWADKSKSLTVIPLPSSAYEKILDASKMLDPLSPYRVMLPLSGYSAHPELPQTINGHPYKLLGHQTQSLKAWKNNSYQGVFALCTGSGKTIMALHAITQIANALRQNAQSCAVVVAVPYQVLAIQWATNMQIFGMDPICCWGGESKWAGSLIEKIGSFDLDPLIPSFLPILVVNKTLRENELFTNQISKVAPENMMFVGDECHHHTSSAFSSKIPFCSYKMGLSATPWNKDREEEKATLTQIYSHPVAYFGMEEALELDVLCPYVYQFAEVELNEEEWEEYLELSRKIAGAMSGQAGSNDKKNLDIWRGARSRIVGSCKAKFDEFEINYAPHMHSKSLVYVGDGSVESDVSDSTSAAEERDITRATKIVRGQGLVVQQFTARETPKTREGILESFLQGHTNTVVAIRVLDEGFDLPSVSEAYLLASSRSERQFIQRRGRILRKSRGKDFAKVVDFLVFPPGHSESDSAKNLVINELIRAYEFVRFAKDNYESLVRLKEIMRKYDLNVDQIQDGTATREDYLSWMTS